MNTRKYIITKQLYLLIFSVTLMSCVSTGNNISESFKSDSPSVGQNLTKTQILLIDSALEACNKGYPNTLKFGNRSFSNDCSGLIYGIFWSGGIDLISAISSEKGNGVKRIYSVLNKKKLIHKNRLPNPGDLVFWNNTYGTWGTNPLSHIGIIISVDKTTGSIDYVHNNTYLGEIRRETMNLYKPHEKRPVNNYMRYDSKYKKTAGELFDSFGMAWKL